MEQRNYDMCQSVYFVITVEKVIRFFCIAITIGIWLYLLGSVLEKVYFLSIEIEGGCRGKRC